MTVTMVRLLTLAEAAAALKVSVHAVTRRAESGRLLVTRTLGGRRRYFAAEVEVLAAGVPARQARELALAEQARLTGGT